MRKLLLRLAAFCLLQVAVGLLVYPTALAVHRPGYLAALDDKIELLKRDGPPRIIFAGGSSVAFGINSQMFADRLDQPVVNLGLHGAMGLDFYLRMVERHARPGDTVVLLPEYSLLLARLELSPEDLRRSLRNSPASIRYMAGNLRSLKVFLDTMALSELAFWTQKGTLKQQHNAYRYARRTYLWVKRKGRPLPPIRTRSLSRKSTDSIYRRRSFNEFGDMVAHHGRRGTDKLESDFRVEYDQRRVATSIARLNRFAKKCERRNVNVYFSYPPIPKEEFSLVRRDIRKLQRDLESSLAPSITIVNGPDDTAFPESMFFDTVTHLGESGQNERSEVLFRGLAREIVARREAEGRVLR